MKAKIIVLTAFVGLLLAASFAVAEEAAVTASVDDISGDVSITPDSAFYGLKLGWERAKLAFTFNQERKAQKELELANKRLVEARVMAENGNAKGFAKAQEAHDRLLERAQARLEAIDEDSKEAKIKEVATKISGLQVAIEVHENKIAVLKEKLADESLTDEQKESIEALIDKMEAKNDAFKEKLEQRKENVKTKLRAVGDKSEEEVESEIEKIDDEAKLDDVMKKIAERRIARAEAAMTKVDAKLENVKAKGVDVSAAETKISEFETNIASAKSAYDAGDYAKAIAEIKPVSNYGRQRSAIAKVIAEARQDAKDAVVEVGDKVKVKASSDSAGASADVDADDVSASASAGSSGASADVDAGGVNVVAGAGQVIAINP